MSSPSPSTSRGNPAQRAHYALVAVFLCLVVAVASAMYRYLSAESDAVKRSVRDELSIIADVRVKQITDFLDDRKGDLKVIQANAVLVEEIRNFVPRPPRAAAPAKLISWMDATRLNGPYASVQVVTPNGDVALSVGKADPGGESIKDFAKELLRSTDIVMRDFHRDAGSGEVRLDLGCRLRVAGDPEPFAALVVTIDPSDSLYPGLKAWPTAEQTGETLLVRRDPDTVMILNQSRRGGEPPMTVQVPLIRKEVASVQAALGTQGEADGVNYRGDPVFATARQIPGTRWAVLAEIDQAEVQTRLARRFIPAAFAAVCLVLAAAAGVGLLWRRQQAAFYRDLYRSEVERRALADHYGFLSRYANDIIMLGDDTGRIIEANDRAVETYGYSREELFQMKSSDLWYPPETDRLVKLRNETIERGSAVFETLHRRRDGSALPVEVSARAVVVDGRMFLQGIIRDTTERKAMNARLLQSEERFRKVVEHAPEAIVVESDLKIHYVNPVAVRLLGAETAAELLDRNILEFIPPEDRYAGIARSAEALSGKLVTPVEGRLIDNQGRTRVVEISAAPIEFDQSPAALVFLRDIAERKRIEAERAQLEAQLLQSQKMESIGRLAGGIAHDFNNYLLVINGYCEKLCEEIEAHHPMREPLEEIRAAGERAAALTAQLLAFSRKQPTEFKPTSLNALVSDSGKLLHRLIGEDVETTIRLDADPIVVLADRSQLTQVLMNLAVNARDAMPNGGALTIETSSVQVEESHRFTHPDASPGKYGVIAVTDTGVGMTAETLQRIFEPFFTTKLDGEGTGLGLATAYGIARQAGGWIEASSERGKGARFQVFLPLLEGADVPVIAPALKQPEQRASETILVVEDRPDVRKLALMILKPQGYRLLEAGSGAEALRVSERVEGPIDLLLTDMVMPGLNGRQLASRMQAIRPGLKVLYVSGYAASAMEDGDGPQAQLLSKPFTAVQLVAKVREVLGSA